MKLSLTPEQTAAVEGARAFARARLHPRVTEFEERGVPKELVRELGDAGLLGALVGDEWGGRPLDPVTWGLVTEEIGKVCCNTRYILTVHASIVAGTLARWGSAAQKSEWLPRLARGEALAAFALSEPDVGSDAASVRTCYEKTDDGFILRGAKRWTSLGALADVFLVIARDANGENGRAVTAFLVPRQLAGVRVEPIRGMMAARGSHIAELHFDNVKLSRADAVGRPGAGFTYVTSTALDLGRYSVAWSAVAVAQAAIEAMVSYALRREQFGRPLQDFQLVKAMVGDAVTDTHAARALCLHAGELRRAADPEAIMATNVAKQFAARVATRTTAAALQLHGANGLSSDYDVERLFREARVLEIIEGSTQIQQLLLGDYGLQTYARATGYP
ncbi:acyl-CoA dehydrogenase family protein [Pendulispora brunnea]|uniref:Acyl-CoA dehydrogenase family protein n=1 Tax=Pendulispora brunnea TaxID=2905690 RepID=A0ABZ2KH17_9BACT